MDDNGHLNLLSHDSFASGVPHKTFERLRREEPLSWTDGNDETEGFWSLTTHADINQANREGSVSAQAKGSGLRIKATTNIWRAARSKKQTHLNTPQHAAR